MAHRNAPLTELGRLRLARLIVEEGWPAARAAERFQVSRTTAHHWCTRYRAQGPAAMADRSSRPHRCPGRTPTPVVRKVVHLGAHPGDLVHVDIKKLGNIPAGGWPPIPGRAAGKTNSQADRSSGRSSRHRNPLIGHGFIHAAVDDHSRLAYAEIHWDETGQTAAGFLTRAQAWFADHGVSIQRVLTDNGGCYRSHLWRYTCQQLAVTHKRTRPCRPQTNGKVERFNRTLVDGWAYRLHEPPRALQLNASWEFMLHG